MHCRRTVLSRRLCQPRPRLSRPLRRPTRRLVVNAATQPTLLEIFSAVSEGRLSPVDAAQTVEETLCKEGPKHESPFPRVIRGQGKRPEWTALQFDRLLQRQGCALATGIDPSAYAAIRNAVPGVVYHAGAKTLRIDGDGAGRKLPGSVAIVSDVTVPTAALEEMQVLIEYFGGYAFQIPSLSVHHLRDTLAQIQSKGSTSWGGPEVCPSDAAEASAVVVLYSEEGALPDIVTGSVVAPVVCVRVGEDRAAELPSSTLVTSTVFSAALSVAKILSTADRVISHRSEDEAAAVDVELLSLLQSDAPRVNNVVSSEVREAAPAHDLP